MRRSHVRFSEPELSHHARSSVDSITTTFAFKGFRLRDERRKHLPGQIVPGKERIAAGAAVPQIGKPRNTTS
jgi:hypothetical protein